MPRRAKQAFKVQTGLNSNKMKQMLAKYDDQKDKTHKHHVRSTMSIDETGRGNSETIHRHTEPSRIKDVELVDYSPDKIPHQSEPVSSVKDSGIRIILSLHSAPPSGMLCCRIKPISGDEEDKLSIQTNNVRSPIIVIRENTEIKVPAHQANQSEVDIELLDSQGLSCTIKVSLSDGSHQIMTLPEFGNIGLLIQTFV
jgi:hypothetical protein